MPSTNAALTSNNEAAANGSPAIYVYSYWLILWLVLSVANKKVQPPVLSILFACLANYSSTNIASWYGIKVGVSTASVETQVAVVITEIGATLLGLYICETRNLSIFGEKTVTEQGVVLIVYLAIVTAYKMNPFYYYWDYWPKVLKNMPLSKLISRRLRAPLIPIE